MAFGSPFLAIDLDVVAQAYAAIRQALPQVTVHYAVKCNPEPAILARLDALGSGFEIASLAELRLLAALGVDVRDVLYSNPVKPSEHIAGAWRLGVERFAADSAASSRSSPRTRPARASTCASTRPIRRAASPSPASSASIP